MNFINKRVKLLLLHAPMERFIYLNDVQLKKPTTHTHTETKTKRHEKYFEICCANVQIDLLDTVGTNVHTLMLNINSKHIMNESDGKKRRAHMTNV